MHNFSTGKCDLGAGNCMVQWGFNYRNLQPPISSCSSHSLHVLPAEKCTFEAGNYLGQKTLQFEA
jgi:hypothetical protein